MGLRIMRASNQCHQLPYCNSARIKYITATNMTISFEITLVASGNRTII